MQSFWRDAVSADQWEYAAGTLPVIISMSEAMKELGRIIASVARAPSTVLLLGESGTGKDLIVRAIHALSPRAGKNYVALNCAAVTETLFESELFGHERGAFTGAIEQKKGVWESANGGTLFLDEIAEMPLTMQAKVLRVLENGTIRRVGGAKELAVDVRIVAATNRDLGEMVAMGYFRKDLYYRINVVSLTVLPLRERKEDIPLLFAYFLSSLAKKLGRNIPKIGPGILEELVLHDWPGNIRELQNVVERALAITWGSNELEMKHFGVPSDRSVSRTLHEIVQRYEADVIRRMLLELNGNRIAAAQRLGLSRNSLLEKMKRYGLDKMFPPFNARKR